MSQPSPSTFVATLMLLIGLANVAAAEEPGVIVVLPGEQNWVGSSV